MALLFTSPLSSIFPPSSSTSLSTACSKPLLRLCNKSSVGLEQKFNVGCRLQVPFARRGILILKASIDVDGAESSSPEPSESKTESVTVENLPLESKAQLIQEQRLKMKLAKKIRLRRKRLVRKRQLRKKGRWPPSKMKKNKNV